MADGARTPAPAPARPARRPSRAPARGAARPPAASAAGGAAPAGAAIKAAKAEAARDPRFQKVMDKLQQSATKGKQHPPAGKKAAEAQAAAQPPANEKLAGAQANKVDTMKEAETGKPQPSSFLEMLRAEIQKVMPKKTEDAKDFMKGDDKQQLKGTMTGNVNQQKDAAAGGMKSASDQPPDTGSVEGKPVTPLPSEPAPAAPPAIGAAEALPAPKPDSEVSLQQGKQNAEQSLSDAKVTPQQLQKANDPRFSAVLTAKQAADKQADSAPQQYRASEQQTIAQSAARAVSDEKGGLAAMQSQQGKSGAAIKARQLTAKEKDELERKKVTDRIQAIFDKTKATVDKKLASLETDVAALFDKGADAAVAKMKDYVEKRFDDRYSGFGAALWLKDKLLPLPPEVKAWFDQAHQVFMRDLDALVVQVANMVEGRLKEAKDEIAKGQKEISDYVAGLPANLQAVGKAAEQEMKGRFDELRQGVDDKKNDLAQSLAQRYKDAYDKGAAALKEMKDAHKSLYEKMRDALLEVIEVLRNFKNRVMGMLKKGQETIDLIVADPIGFLKNLLNAIKQGINQFKDNIWEHLKAGFMKWLFGSLANAGITLPKDLSLPSILMLVLQVLGLTYAKLRAKAVKLIGERNVAIIEKIFELLKALWDGGPAALWEKLKEFLSDLKQMVIDAIQDWIVTSIVKAAITKLATMFNPVGAIIQAIITIYNTVMFFIERINQILDFVEAIINSVHKIATGDIGSAAKWVEQALARTIPIIIGFLARLLGLSGITEKIVSTIKKVQAKVDEAVDKVIEKIVGFVKKLFGGGKGKADDRTEAQKKADLHKAIADGEGLMGKKNASPATVKAKLPGIQSKYRLTELTLVKDDENQYHLHGKINPDEDAPKHTLDEEGSIYVDVTKMELKPKFQGKVIRDKFYKKKFRKKPRKAVLDRAAVDGGMYRCQNTGPKGPKHTDIIATADLTIEHTTSVVEHWNGEGNNQIQTERNNWYDDESHLVVFCRSCNLSDQEGEDAQTYKPQVGPRFRGPKDRPLPS